MRWLIVLVLMVSLADCARAQSSAPPVWLRPTLGAAVPMDVVLTSEDGTLTTLRACADGKPTILVFTWYDCPMLCTEVLNGLTRALIELPQDAGKDYQVVVVSIDPRAAPALAAAKKATTLRRYGRPGAESGWHFLTGDEQAIVALTTACGFHYTYDEVTHQYAHPAGVLVLTPDGHLSRCLLGISFLPDDLRVSLVEASRGTVGTLVEKLQLLCWSYDPTSSRYGRVVLAAMRTASLLTMLAVAVGIWRSVRREKHASAH